MTSRSVPSMTAKETRDYVFERARSLAFDAVYALWQKRQSEGIRQKDIAEKLEKREAWVSRSLRGPGNWTVRTLAELTDALGGELEITVRPIEDISSKNYHAYVNYPLPVSIESPTTISAKPNFGYSDARASS